MADLKGKLVLVRIGAAETVAGPAARGIASALNEAGAEVLETEDTGLNADVIVEWHAPQVWSVHCRTRQGPAQLLLHVDAQEAPLFVGRCVAALAMDPDLMEKTGGSYTITELACEYRFSRPENQ